jgi:hypothetical protein
VRTNLPSKWNERERERGFLLHARGGPRLPREDGCPASCNLTGRTSPRARHRRRPSQSATLEEELGVCSNSTPSRGSTATSRIWSPGHAVVHRESSRESIKPGRERRRIPIPMCTVSTAERKTLLAENPFHMPCRCKEK